MPQGDFVIAVDIGTESGRAAAIDFDGRVLASSSRPFSVSCPRPNWVEQNPADWWEATVQNIRSVVSHPSVDVARVRAVAVCGQMHAPVPIARDGRLAAERVALWCDKRAAGACEAVAASPDYRVLSRLAGNPACAAWSGFKIGWLRQHEPGVYEAARTLLTCKDYINFLLSGEMATDYSEASGSYLFDATSRRWSTELCERLGVDRAKLPEVLPADTVLGSVTADASRTTGLLEGTPVAVGGGDMMCLLLGAGIARHGMAADVAGSAADVSVFLPHPVLDPRLMNLHHVVPGWVAFGILDAGGMSLKWFKDTLCPLETEEGRRTGVSPYDVICRSAAEVAPGSDGLVFLPYLLGERTLGSAHSRGVFFGLEPTHTRAHMARAVLEGVAFDLRQSLEIIRETGIGVPEVRATGGGARSDLWCNIKANVYHAEIVALQENEGGIVGAAILAACAVGAFGSAAEAAERMVKERARFRPDPGLSACYDRSYQLWKVLHDGLQEEFRKAAMVRECGTPASVPRQTAERSDVHPCL